MASNVVITHKEAAFFLLSLGVVVFLVVYGITGAYYMLATFFILLSYFVMKRKEIYFVWSAVAPRITGSAPILNNLLILAREEAACYGAAPRRGKGDIGSSAGEDLNDLLRLDIPCMKPVFFIFKPTYVKKVLSTEAENFPTKGDEGVLVKLTHTPNNVLLKGGPPCPLWTRYRELTAAMNKGRADGEGYDSSATILSAMFASGWQACQDLTHIFDAKRDPSRPLDLFYELFFYMLPAHNRALFGDKCANQHTYTRHSEDMYDVVFEAGKQLKCSYTTPAREQNFLEKVKRISDAVLGMGKTSSTPFAQTWKEALQNGDINEEEFASNMLTFEYAQAPLHAVFWVIYMLALHPEVERNVMTEIASVLQQGSLEYCRLNELRYLEKVIAETLRLYPGVGLLQARYPRKDCMLGRHLIPAGSPVFVSPFLIQRNARLWVNPDEFNPNREGLMDATNVNLVGDNLTYIPFGYGPRHCPGQYYAQDFIKAALVSLLQHHKISLVEGQKAAIPTEIGFLRPEQSIYFTFSERVMSPQSPYSSPYMSPYQGEIGDEFDDESKLNAKGRRHSTPRVVLSPKLSRSTSKLYASPRMGRRLSVTKQVNKSNLLILWGSQSGRSRMIAQKLAKMSGLYNVECLCLSMAFCDISTILQYQNVLVVTSTYGDGGPPENGEKMNAWLNEDHPSNLLRGLKYSVLCLGSTVYPKPFQFGEFVSRRFSQLGAQQLVEDEKIDEMRCFDENTYIMFTHRWGMHLFSVLTCRVPQSKHESNALLRSQGLRPPFDLHWEDTTLELESRVTYTEKVVFANVSRNEVVNKDSDNKIFELELNCSHHTINFQPGDNIGVMPANNVDAVHRLISRLGFSKNRVFVVAEPGITSILSPTSGVVESLACSKGKNKCTLEIALTYYYDIAGSPSKSMLDFLAANCTDTEAQKLLTYSSDNYADFLQMEYSVLDLLELFPSIQLHSKKGKERKSKESPKTDEALLGEFLSLLKPLRPRVYSVANYSAEQPSSTVKLVYKAVEYTAKNGRKKQGVCSSWLQSRKSGDQIGILVVTAKFRLPQKPEVPVIMVGAGTGISPYFSFLEKRMHELSNHNLGRSILVHGCRSDADIPNMDIINRALKNGALSNFWTAFSRSNGADPVYAQHVIEENGSEIWNLLENQHGHLFLSGDEKMKTGVREVIMNIAQVRGCLDADQAKAWWKDFVASGRLQQ